MGRILNVIAHGNEQNCGTHELDRSKMGGFSGAFRRESGSFRSIDFILGVAVAGAFAGLCLLVADQCFRPAWDFSWVDHWQGAPVLFLGPSALLGVLWSQLSLLNRWMTSLGLKSIRPRRWARSAVVGLMGAGLSAPTALLTFSGPAVSKTAFGTWGPYLFLTLFFLGVTLVTREVGKAQLAVERKRYRRASVTAGLLFLCATLMLIVDMTVYVGLYRFLHHFLEYCAFACYFAVAQLIGYAMVRKWSSALIASRLVGACLIGVGAAYVALPALRVWVDSQLAHAWVDEFYAGRTLRRLSHVELILRGGDSLQMQRVRTLRRRFDVLDDSLARAYTDPTIVAADELEGSERKLNLVVFYVDTLRWDVAADPVLMPNLAAFRAQALDFHRAYASGSDTLRSLPTILRGNYFLDKTHPGELLRLAEFHRIRRHLVISQSAGQFLNKLLPGFIFDQTDYIADVDEDEDVWGYGAHRPTARQVVDRGIEFLSEVEEKPFLLWLFQFDQHGWRELDEGFIDERGQALGVSKEGRFPFRYRVLARSIDEEFGRFMRALDASPHAERTAVLFLSDHGEGLGRGGFWVHSIFLWENLVRVPLALRLPGHEPMSSRIPVSLVDVTPTIAALWGGVSAVYHGQDLRGALTGQKRQFPILLRGGQFDSLDRIGMIDDDPVQKLVVRVEAGFPELYELVSDPQEKNNLARIRSERVSALVRKLARTPVFPRRDEDFLHIERLSELLAVADSDSDGFDE